MSKRGDSVRPRGLSLGMNLFQVPHGVYTLFILLLSLGSGWVSCLSHGDRSGHPQSCNQGLFVCGWD